jgi:hypothetical protein
MWKGQLVRGSLGVSDRVEARAKLASIKAAVANGTYTKPVIVRARADTRSKREIARIHALRRYGLTQEAYEVMWQAQEGLCAICRRPETTKSAAGHVKPLHVDHNHTTNVVRGLLCNPCNSALGLFAEDRERLRAAIDYLDHHPRALRNEAA